MNKKVNGVGILRGGGCGDGSGAGSNPSPLIFFLTSPVIFTGEEAGCLAAGR